jgi:hypothetical protein
MGAVGRRVAALLLALAVALGLGPAGAAAPLAPALATRPAAERGGERSDADHGRPPEAAAPPGFATVMGYEPVPARLHGSGPERLVKPSGSCSSPLGQKPFGFGVICKAHDFGYDLLRFAARSGREAAVPAARRLIDGQFDHDLHAHCAATRHGFGRLACDGLAAVYVGAVRLNSWWQDEGMP